MLQIDLGLNLCTVQTFDNPLFLCMHTFSQVTTSILVGLNFLDGKYLDISSPALDRSSSFELVLYQILPFLLKKERK